MGLSTPLFFSFVSSVPLAIGCSCSELYPLTNETAPGAQRQPLSSPEDSRDELEKPPELDTSGWSRERLLAYFNRLRGDAYPLDDLARHLETPDETVPCLAEDQERYRGTHLELIPITVHPAFIERLAELERIIVEESESTYGRAPSTVWHQGGYACRKSRFRSTRISEHAFGNAIDITGFSFPPMPKETTTESSAAPRSAFRLRIGTHWTSSGGETADLHQEFLQGLAERIVAEEVIRVALGPSHRGHADHLHFDMSPWRYTHL